MAAASIVPERISITPETVREARESAPEQRGAHLLVETRDGDMVRLPVGVEDLLLRALAAIGERGAVTISQIPDALTSTVAAEILGVSRPTLMKWVGEGRIQSFKVGSHARFRREAVMALKREREQERQAAFSELLALDLEHDLLD